MTDITPALSRLPVHNNQVTRYTKVARIYNSLTPKIQKNSLRNFRFGWRKA